MIVAMCDSPLALLQITSPIFSDQSMVCAEDSANSGHDIAIFVQVGLSNRVVLCRTSVLLDKYYMSSTVSRYYS